MSITGITNQVISNGFKVGSHQNSASSTLRKEKELLQEQIKNIRDGKEDSQTKQEKIKALTEQIQQIDQQITQMESQEKQQQMTQTEKRNKTLKENGEDTKNNIVSSNLNSLVSEQGIVSEIHQLGKIRGNILNGKSIAEGQIKNAANGASSTYQLEEIGKAASKVYQISSDMGKKHQEVQKRIKNLMKTQDQKMQQLGNPTLNFRENIIDITIHEDDPNSDAKKSTEIDVIV